MNFNTIQKQVFPLIPSLKLFLNLLFHQHPWGAVSKLVQGLNLGCIVLPLQGLRRQTLARKRITHLTLNHELEIKMKSRQM